jgi:hypothetical protein
LGSAEGKAAAGDLANFADGGADLYFFDAKQVWGSGFTQARTSATARGNFPPSRADRLAVYLRAAQAYMLISMPTGTSTIFGVFQVMRFSQLVDSKTYG